MSEFSRILGPTLQDYLYCMTLCQASQSISLNPYFSQCPYLGNVTHPYLGIGQAVCLTPWFPSGPGWHYLIELRLCSPSCQVALGLQQLHLVSHTNGQWGCHGSKHHFNAGRLAASQDQVVGNPVLLVSVKADKTLFMTIQQQELFFKKAGGGGISVGTFDLFRDPSLDAL